MRGIAGAVPAVIARPLRFATVRRAPSGVVVATASGQVSAAPTGRNPAGCSNGATLVVVEALADDVDGAVVAVVDGNIAATVLCSSRRCVAPALRTCGVAVAVAAAELVLVDADADADAAGCINSCTSIVIACICAGVILSPVRRR